MAYEIRMGIPETDALWKDLQQKHREGTATRKEEGIWSRATANY